MTTLPKPGSFPAEPTAFPGPYSKSTKLPTGEWNVLANGRIYKLDITGVSGSTVTANLSSGTIEAATWNKNARTLTFTRVLPNKLRQEFTGHLLDFHDGADPMWRMAGVFGKKGEGPQAGWYATRLRA